MKRYLAMILTAVLLLACAAPAARADTRWGTPEEAALAARDLLLQAWREEFADPRNMSKDPTLEIRGVRVFAIRETPEALMPNGSPISAVSLFEGVAYVVEFTLLADLNGTAPYRFAPGYKDHVTLRRDGSCEIGNSPFRVYSARAFDFDYTGIIESLTDLGDGLSGVWELK